MRRRGKKCRDTVIDRSPPIELPTRFHSRGAFQATRGMFGNRRRNVNGENLRILYCSQFFQFQRTNQPRWTMNSSTSNERILLYLALFYVFVPRLSRRCSSCFVIEIAPLLWNRIDKKKKKKRKKSNQGPRGISTLNETGDIGFALTWYPTKGEEFRVAASTVLPPLTFFVAA